MSRISRTSANIKKKLSFGDYGKPAKQQTSKKVKQAAAKPVKQKAVKQVVQHTSEPVQQLAAKPASQPAGNKMKATYYLGSEEIKMMTNMYIDRLRKYNKADKSSIICEAIRTLYEREK